MEFVRLLFAIAAMLTLVAPVHPAEVLRGPVEVHVLRVIDGDTFEADAMVWPGHTVRVSVRIRGIDAPELRSRCTAEKRAARDAQAELAGLISNQPVLVTNIGGDKFYGRVVADVATPDGRNVGPLLVGLGAAREYAGGKREPFCKI